MNNQKSEHSKRLLKTRQEFSQLTKTSVNKWKRIKQIKDNKRLDELQNQEIERINKQLIDLREEYKRITSERGSAHKWAQIVAKHESDANEFEKRRNAEVLKRSKHNFNQFIDENNVKQNNIKIEKQNQILKRKQLMKSSLSIETKDKEVRDILRQLNDFKRSESVLRGVIKKKKDLSHSEKSIERMAEKLFWPKKLVSKQEFIDSIVSSIDSKDWNQMLNEKQKNLKSFDGKENDGSNAKTTEVLKMSSIRDNNSDEYLPISIATKLYERLRIHQKDMNSGQKETKNKKVYRNVAISTSPQNISLEINNDLENIEKSSADNWSQQTSYLEVPNDPNMATNKATIALSQMFKNLNNRLNCFENKFSVPNTDFQDNSFQDLTLEADESSNYLDPLLIRINNLKELIDKKVGQKSTTRGQDLNFDEKVSKLELLQNNLENNENQTNDENESKSQVIDNLDAISGSTSSTSFQTLQALTTSRGSSPSFDSSIQVLDLLNKDFHSMASNVSSFGSVCNQIQSNNSSLISSEPIRDRNVFWKNIFERAGIDIDINRINEFFPSLRTESEPIVDTFASFTLSSLSTDPNSHSTPKH